MVRDLNPKNLHISALNFLQNQKKKNYFGGVFGYYPQNKIFSQKSSSFSFLHVNTLTSWQVSEKSYEPFWRKCVYLLIYWHTDSRTPFRLKTGVQQINEIGYCRVATGKEYHFFRKSMKSDIFSRKILFKRILFKKASNWKVNGFQVCNFFSNTMFQLIGPQNITLMACIALNIWLIIVKVLVSCSYWTLHDKMFWHNFTLKNYAYVSHNLFFKLL